MLFTLSKILSPVSEVVWERQPFVWVLTKLGLKRSTGLKPRPVLYASTYVFDLLFKYAEQLPGQWIPRSSYPMPGSVPTTSGSLGECRRSSCFSYLCGESP